ncbi:hypothetical protein Tco_0797139 [Tanacetum coccineum]
MGCLDLEADMSKVHDESKLISKLEREYLNLQLKYQHLQESFDNKNSQASQEAPDFNSFFKTESSNIRLRKKDNVDSNHLKDLVVVDFVKPKVLAPGMYAIDVKPIPHPLKNNRSAHLNYISHLKESVCRKELLECVIGTCPKSSNERDNKAPFTPVPRKSKGVNNSLKQWGQSLEAIQEQ